MHHCRGEGATVLEGSAAQTSRCLNHEDQVVVNRMIRRQPEWLGMCGLNARIQRSKLCALPLGESPTGFSFTGRPSSEHYLRLLL